MGTRLRVGCTDLSRPPCPADTRIMEETRSLGLLDGAPGWEIRLIGWMAFLVIAWFPIAMHGAGWLDFRLTALALIVALAVF